MRRRNRHSVCVGLAEVEHGPVELPLAAGRRATAVRVERRDELEDAIAALRLPHGAPVVVLVGGAAHMSGPDAEKVRVALLEAVVPAVEAAGAILVDGGTDSGVMRLAGEARDELQASFPLLGVVVDRLARAPGRHVDDDAADLDARHTHFVLVPGESWGDEAPWIAAVAAAVAGTAPSVTVLANGGEIAWDDVAFSVDARRPVVVLTGSGRTADEVAAAATDRARRLHDSGLVRAVPVDDREQLAAALTRELA